MTNNRRTDFGSTPEPFSSGKLPRRGTREIRVIRRIEAVRGARKIQDIEAVRGIRRHIRTMQSYQPTTDK